MPPTTTLGQQISRLRAAHGLSQEDLASALQVSRQSVSKWETDTSVPELDKLLKLSELFGVTLDELVKGPLSAEAEPTSKTDGAPTESGQPEPSPEVHGSVGTSGSRKVIGTVLLCFGALVALVFLLLSGSLFGCVFALPFLLCGLLCLTAKKRAGLWCGWVWFACLMLYFRYATGIRWTLVLQTIGYDPQWNYLRLAIAWVMLLAMLLMVICTARSFRRVRVAPTRRNAGLLAAGWGLWLLLPQLLRVLVFQSWFTRISSPNGLLGSAYTAYSLAVTAENCLRFLTLNVLVIGTLALRRGRKAQKLTA